MLAAKPLWWEVRGGLHVAVERNDREAAHVLLAHGKKLGWEAWGGHVEKALFLGHVAMIEVLLSGGASVTYRGHQGRSLLATAIRTGQSDAAALLRKHGANDADVGDVDRALGACMLGVSPANDGPRRFAGSDHMLLAWALGRGKTDAVPALLALGLDPNVPDEDGETPLHLAVTARSIDALSALLAAGARVDAKNFAAETPLALALREPRSELREALTERLRRAGAASDVDVRESFELFEEAADAVVDGDVARLRDLLDAHPGLATARSRRAHKSTLLHYVGANGVEWERQRSPKNAGRIAELLIERGAAPDAFASVYGHADTTLGLAVTSGFPEKAGVMEDIVGALVRGGAKVDGVDGGGGPLMGAIGYGRASAMRALVSAGARIKSVRAAAAVGRLDLVKGFAAAGGDEATKEDMEQALVHAAFFGRTEVVDFLLERGVDPGAKDHQAFTPLHWAAFNGHVDAVRLLLSRGAPLEVKNIYGGTVLDATVWASKNGSDGVDHVPVVELLLAAGADIEAVGPLPAGTARVDEVLARHRAGPDGAGRVKAP
jgi:ankyrin repeat protein